MSMPHFYPLHFKSVALIAALGAAASGLQGIALAQGHASINASVTIVESGQEPAPVHRATQDLLSDFSKVFGRAPKTLDQLNPGDSVSILIAQSQNVPTGIGCSKANDPETF